MTIADLLAVTRVRSILKNHLRTCTHCEQTSGYLRSICRGDRNIWKLALDADMLPIPVGETIDSIDMSQLFSCAARAISISGSLRKEIVVPRRSLEPRALYDLPGRQSWKFLSNRGRPSKIYILPGGHSFLIPFRHLALYSLHGPYIYEFDIPGVCSSWDWETHDNSTSFILSTAWAERPRSSDFSIMIHKVQYDPLRCCRDPPIVSLVYSCRLPPLRAPVSMCIRNSSVLIWGKPWPSDAWNKILLINLKENTCVRMFPHFSDMFHVVHETLHPRLRVVVLLAADGIDSKEASLDVIDLDSPLPELSTVDAVNENFPDLQHFPGWEIQCFARRRLTQIVRDRFPRNDPQYFFRWSNKAFRFHNGSVAFEEVFTLANILARSSRVESLRHAVTPNCIATEYACSSPRFLSHPVTVNSGRTAVIYREDPDSRWTMVQLHRQNPYSSDLDIPLEFVDSKIMAVDDIRGIFISLEKGRIIVLQF
ncbi:hypothetical protein C8J57DRAFT_1395647 [Mycena rebaudengoi]|nr:hypothetical protein C8J57DRAFT_1395647 [Mycena rebaudengoi]